MKIKKELIVCQIAGDTILVPVGKTIYQANGLFVLNELGAFLWERLEKAETEEDLLSAVLSEYEVTSEEALGDIRDFLAKLRAMDIL